MRKEPTHPFVANSTTSKPLRKNQYEMRLTLSPKYTDFLPKAMVWQSCFLFFSFFLLTSIPSFSGDTSVFPLENHSSTFLSPCGLSWGDPTSGSRSSQSAYYITQVLVFCSGIGLSPN